MIPKLNNDSHAPSAFVLLLTNENLVMTVKGLFIVLVFLLRLVFIDMCQLLLEIIIWLYFILC